MVMVKPALPYLDVVRGAARRVRRPGRGVPRERRVRDVEGGRRARLDRRRRRRARGAHVDQAGGCRLRAHVPRARRRRTPLVSSLFTRALARIPGGVDSPVRSFASVGGEPFFVAGADGPYLVDTDGRRYVDYVQSWGASILGHAHPAVVDAVQRAAAAGTSYGAPTEREVELAEAIAARVPSVDKVRLVSSGTEAAMTAVRLARGATGRPKILKFAGCYHGHVDALLVSAGSGVATLGLPGLRRRHRGHRRRHRRRALQRRGRARRGVRPLRHAAGGGDRRAGRRQHGPGAARGRLPRRAAAALHRRRRAADLRRGHHRLPARARRRAGPLRPHPRPVDVRQGRGRRPPARRARWPGRPHGPARPARSRVPGGDPEREPARHRRRARRPGPARRRRLRRPRRPGDPLRRRSGQGAPRRAR